MDMNTLRSVAGIYRHTRRWFDSKKFIEVRTNAFGSAPGFDGYVAPFSAAYSPPGGQARRLFLSSSPEFEMKRLAFAGADRIFQVCRAFRNAEHDLTHRPEFDMLEWYSTGTGYRDAMRQTEDLVRHVSRKAGGRGEFVVHSRSVPLGKSFERIKVRDVFLEMTGIDLCLVQEREDFLEAARRLGITHIRQTASWDTVFFILFLDKVEAGLARIDKPVILCDYPVQLASLARTVPDDPRFVERFEISIQGLELCNGYSELTDRAGHSQRLELVNSQRRQEGFEPLAFPGDFLASLPEKAGKLSGVALGMDRLAMLVTGQDDIGGIVPFDPFM